PFSRLREKVPGGRMRGRERSEACFCCCLEEQEQLASLAPSSGASRHLLPLRRRRAFSGRCGRDLTGKPFSRLREKVPGVRMRGRERSEACFCCCLEEQEQLASLAPSSGAARHLLPLRRRRALSGRCGRDLTEEPFSRLREKVPGGRMRGRERSEACFCCCLEEQEQLASLAPSSGASRHL